MEVFAQYIQISFSVLVKDMKVAKHDLIDTNEFPPTQPKVLKNIAVFSTASIGEGSDQGLKTTLYLDQDISKSSLTYGILSRSSFVICRIAFAFQSPYTDCVNPWIGVCLIQLQPVGWTLA